MDRKGPALFQHPQRLQQDRLPVTADDVMINIVAGKSDYRYSKEIVYNTFPWPEPTEAQRQKIEQTAQGILDARALFPETPMATLYDRNLMPRELQKAHQANDLAVMKAYGMPIKETDEAACFAWLMRLYQEKAVELKTKL